MIRRALYTRCVRDMILCLVSVVARGHAHGDESGEERAQCMRVPFINLQDTRDPVAKGETLWRPSPAQTLYNTCVTITRRPASSNASAHTRLAAAPGLTTALGVTLRLAFVLLAIIASLLLRAVIDASLTPF